VEKKWHGGYLMCIAAGVTMLVAAFMPWAQLDAPPATYTAFEMRMWEPLAFTVLTGAALVIFGALRTMWSAFVAMGGAFAATITTLMIHENVYVGLRVVQPGLALGQTTHVTGFGVAALFAAGMLAGAAGLITAVQAAPVAVTSERMARERGGTG
jgi:hypothetical protein